MGVLRFTEPPSIVEARPKVVEAVKVTVLRHGEGHHNVNTSGMTRAGWELLNNLLSFKVYDAAVQSKKIVLGTYTACNMRDPGLTEKGVREAVAIRKLATHPFDVIYASPMMRTVETAVKVFGGVEGLRIVLHPGCCETRTLAEGSNAGNYKSELKIKIDKMLSETPSIKATIDLTYLPTDAWWVPLTETTTQLSYRAAQFRSFLLSQPHRNVAVVSHATFLTHLTSDTSRLATCQWKSYLCTARGFLSSNGPKGAPSLEEEGEGGGGEGGGQAEDVASR